MANADDSEHLPAHEKSALAGLLHMALLNVILFGILALAQSSFLDDVHLLSGCASALIASASLQWLWLVPILREIKTDTEPQFPKFIIRGGIAWLTAALLTRLLFDAAALKDLLMLSVPAGFVILFAATRLGWMLRPKIEMNYEKSIFLGGVAWFAVALASLLVINADAILALLWISVPAGFVILFIAMRFGWARRFTRSGFRAPVSATSAAIGGTIYAQAFALITLALAGMRGTDRHHERDLLWQPTHLLEEGRATASWSPHFPALGSETAEGRGRERRGCESLPRPLQPGGHHDVPPEARGRR